MPNENALSTAKQFMKALSAGIQSAGRATPETGRHLVQYRSTLASCRKLSVINRLLRGSHLDNWVENHRYDVHKYSRLSVPAISTPTQALFYLAFPERLTEPAARIMAALVAWNIMPLGRPRLS